MTAPITARLRSSSVAIVSSIVSRREQVPGVDRVLLADAVAAILGLVVLGGRPVELEESDVRGARQRDALAGDLDRADDQLVVRPSGSWKALQRLVAGGVAVFAEDVQRAWGSARARARWISRWRANTTSRSPEEQKSWIQASAACSLPRAASSLSAFRRTRRSARKRRRDLRVELAQVERLAAQPRDHVAARPAGTRPRCRARPARPRASWPAAAAARRPSVAARSSARAGASAGAGARRGR